MEFQGFVGPTYNLKSVNVDCQRCVNLYPETVESGDGKQGNRFYLKSTPGKTKIANVGSGPIRCIKVDLRGTVLVASGSEVYKIVYSAGVWTPTKLGDLDTSSGIINARSTIWNVLTDTIYATIFVEGNTSYVYTYDNPSTVEFFGSFASYGGGGPFSFPQVDGATHVALIDSYLIYNKGSSNQFYVSNAGYLTINPLSFGSAEGDPDNIVAVIENRRELWLFNERTTEVWYDTGNADFPFERIQGGFFEMGCVAKYSVAKIEGSLFWLGRDEFGQGMVYAANGLVPQRISNHAVENAVKNSADMSVATAYTYQSGGHSFYVLNLTEGTWVFDLSTKLWHERAYTNAGVLERDRAGVHQFIPAYGIHMVGDYSSNKVYQFDDLVYADDGNAITRMRVAPHVSADLNRVFYKKLQIDMETGIGLNGSVQGSNPLCTLDWSNDGGHTWSSETFAAMDGGVGSIGNYKTRVIFRRLGSARDRVFRLKVTDPVPITILGAQFEIEPAAS